MTSEKIRRNQDKGRMRESEDQEGKEKRKG